MGTFSNNTTMKVSRAISGAITVASNGYAIATYYPSTTVNPSTNNTNMPMLMPITQYFGPSQSVPATITYNAPIQFSGASLVTYTTVTYALSSGVEFINTP